MDLSAFNNPAVIALIGTLFGGMGLKLTENILGRSRERNDLATQLRVELRAEVTELKNELRRVESELDDWKDKYYQLKDMFIKYEEKEAQRTAQEPTNTPRTPRKKSTKNERPSENR